MQSNPVRVFQTNQSTVSVGSLNPCQSYWVQLTAVDCAALAGTSPHMVANFEPAPLDLVISVSTHDNNIVVTWTSINQNLLEQLLSVQVTVVSECPTGIVPSQTQVFTVTPEEGNSVNVRELGIYFECRLCFDRSRITL